MTLVSLIDPISTLAQTINITPTQPPGALGFLRIIDYLAWLVTLAGVAAIIYAGGRFAWERWVGGQLESPKIVAGALAGGVVAATAGPLVTAIRNAATSDA
ncbi:hypothetical protein IU487_35565 [Nocardia puris]|uniref:hypothetical protein n=1 Tax=Nocardia puris TaxID=208602 RepID=UPI001895F1BB|nr:hypothetical protein [Nocardia puris]MBF6216311.1 hypothetical protein [Nocardia puris]